MRTPLIKRISQKNLFHGAKDVTENRTSLHNDTVGALLSRKLNCDLRVTGFKPSKVELNDAKKATYTYNQARKT